MNIERRLNLLTAYAIVSSLLCCLLLLTSSRGPEVHQTMDELTVKRINIVDEAGQNRMVISNAERQADGRIAGRNIEPRDRPAGMIFFNEAGDECGGLVYQGGGSRGAFLLLSVDQFRDDQVMQLRYTEDTLRDIRQYGLQFWEFPREDTYLTRSDRLDSIGRLETREEKVAAYRQMRADSLLSRDRMFVGKTLDDEVGVFINDGSGRPRIKIFVDTTDTPRLIFLDEEGREMDR